MVDRAAGQMGSFPTACDDPALYPDALHPSTAGYALLAPVYAGDRLRYSSTVVETRASASRPGWGLVFQDNVGVNQRGETVFRFRGCVFWERA